MAVGARTRQPRCRNCGRLHPAVPTHHWTDCVVVSVRTSGSTNSVVDPTDRQITWQIPESQEGRNELFGAIWAMFDRVRTENDGARQSLSVQSPPKGSLKAQEPLIWLSITAATGQRSQTRKQENFGPSWHKVVDMPVKGHDKGVPVAWLTLRNLPAHARRSTQF